MSEQVPLRVLTRRPGLRLAEAELTHIGRTEIDVALAAVQHAAYRAAMAQSGAELIDLPSLEAFPDSVFVEDALLALPECFIMCRPGAASRRGETRSLSACAPKDRPMARITGAATLDGGDVLVVERSIFIGLSTRTNLAAIDQMRTLLSPFGYDVTTVPLGEALHLKTAVTAPRPDLVALNPRWVDRALFARFDQVEVALEEPFSGNTLRVGDALFVQAAHPRMAERLAAKGVMASTLDIGEFAKAEAGLTCMSVVIPPPA